MLTINAAPVAPLDKIRQCDVAVVQVPDQVEIVVATAGEAH